MGIDCLVRQEDLTIIEQVSDRDDLLSNMITSSIYPTPSFDILDAYGDTVFNKFQCIRIEKELTIALRSKTKWSTQQVDRLKKILRLAGLVANGTHLYLWFVGD